MEKQIENFLIIDSNAILHRCYYAIPSLKTKKGQTLNAVYGFLLIFLRALKELHPKFIATTFDLKGPTFRHKKFKEYKAKRVAAPPDFYPQIEKTKEIIRLFNIPIFEKQGFEADDLIGTLNDFALKEKNFPYLQVIILSGDLDILQLVSFRTKLWTMNRGIKDIAFYGAKEVEKRYGGLKPFQLNDMKGLKGDPSDNIPGVPGIGEKTAIKLIKQFKTLEGLYSALNQKPLSQTLLSSINQHCQDLLKKYKEQAFLSKSLCQIQRNVPIKFSLEQCHFNGFDNKKVIELLKDFEFYSLINRLLEQGNMTLSGQRKMNFAEPY